ncbi:MAG: ABC transporter substrate-binding protein, partial [Acetobacteraceae bacterium]|nr:ABC transporter substrate-binding protein [Acetobacteraceae bacterium]
MPRPTSPPIRSARAAALRVAAMAAAVAAVTAAQPPAAARDIAVGLAAPPTSFDPHFHAHGPSIALHLHVFEGLVGRNPDLTLAPALARDWAPLADGGGWEFRLDPAARFGDGTPVTAADVAASLARVSAIPNSPGRWTSFITEIASTEIVDARTLRFRTHGPGPLLPANIGAILVVPERVAREASTADFNAGRAAVGSGRYRLREYAQGERVVLERDPNWWGGAPEPWTRVTFKIIGNDAARVAAVRAGDVDLVEAVPPRDAEALERDPNLAVTRQTSVRLVYIAFDQGRDASPGVADAEGRPLARNPLKDVRVRRALSLAIDREGMKRQVMEGQAVPAGQLLPPVVPTGWDPELRPDPFDPARARALLAAAGWGGGFRLALAGPNNRLVNDEQILQTVAQMWERVGVRTRVEAMPHAVYAGRYAAGAYSAGLHSWGHASGEPNTYFTAVLATPDRARGRGT